MTMVFASWRTYESGELPTLTFISTSPAMVFLDPCVLGKKAGEVITLFPIGASLDREAYRVFYVRIYASLTKQFPRREPNTY
jgi:hypothetical protein